MRNSRCQRALVQGSLLAFLSGVSSLFGQQEKASSGVHFKPLPSATDKAALAALKQPQDLELSDTPLSELPATLAKMSPPVVFRLDEAELKTAKTDKALALTGQYQRLPLHEILGKLLPKHGLDYVVSEGTVVITTRRYANSHLIKRTYDVSGISKAAATTRALLPQISRTTHAADWSDLGGFATMKMDDNTHISISHTHSAHDKIVAFLNQKLAEATKR